MLGRKCLTRVNAIIPRCLLCFLRRSFPIYQTLSVSGFPCLLAGMRLFSRTLDVLVKLAVICLHSLLLSFLFSSCSSFSIYQAGALSGIFPYQSLPVEDSVTQTVRRCTNARLTGRVVQRGVTGSRCVARTISEISCDETCCYPNLLNWLNIF